MKNNENSEAAIEESEIYEGKDIDTIFIKGNPKSPDYIFINFIGGKCIEIKSVLSTSSSKIESRLNVIPGRII